MTNKQLDELTRRRLQESPDEATDPIYLRECIMNPDVPKNESEWWAKSQIEKLEAVIKKYAGHITYPPQSACRIGERLEGGISPCTCLFSDEMKDK